MQATSLQTKCVFLLAILTLSYSRHFPYYHVDPEDNGSSRNENDDCVCTTLGCIKTAANVLSFLDETVAPCDNFFQFACGGWLRRHVIPEDKTTVSVDTDLIDDLNLKLKDLIDKRLDGTEPPFVKMLKDLYDTCMDLESIENLGSEPLKKDLQSLGGWPVVEGSRWDESSFDWVDTLIDFRRLGYDFNMFMNLWVTFDYRNSSLHIIQVDQASLGMPDREYFIRGLNDSATAAYFELMVKEALLLGADENDAKKELLKALEFEIELAKISVPEEERRDFSKMYNKYTVAELQNMIPQVPWLKYFNGLLNDEILESENIVVSEPDFVKNLANLLRKTERRIVANYMFYRIVAQATFLLSKEWRDINREYNSVLKGQSKEAPRWEKCITFLTRTVGIAVGSYYVRHYFNEDSKEAIMELTENIRKAFIDILEDADWMDDVTKLQALAKAKSVKAFMGYPKELLNDTAVTEVHKNLTINSNSYYENAKNIFKWTKDDEFSELRKPNIKGDWKSYAHAAVVNAFYHFEDNSIDFPAGQLQSLYFDKDRPQYMNYGGIGSIVGHEITHGFDDEGRQFDKDGNNVNWWGKATNEHFNEKAQCIIEQYGNYTAENGMKLNGVNTQGENIADNGGVKEAYLAYRSWVEDNGQEPLLPGLKYTQNQLFWISAANVWCGKTRPESLKVDILSDSHSPVEFRVIGQMSNRPEFSEDFHCPADSLMNRKNKCTVW